MKRKVWVFGCLGERGKEEVGCGFLWEGREGEKVMEVKEF